MYFCSICWRPWDQCTCVEIESTHMCPVCHTEIVGGLCDCYCPYCFHLNSDCICNSGGSGSGSTGGGGSSGGGSSGGSSSGGVTPSIIINAEVNLPENLKNKAFEVLNRLEEPNIIITSGIRDLDKQLQTMLNNIKNTSVSQQKAIYGPVGDAVIDQYNPQKSDSENLANMKNKAVELGPDKLSKHIPNETTFAIDISNRSLTNHTQDKIDLESMSDDVVKCLDENGVLHIVINK